MFACMVIQVCYLPFNLWCMLSKLIQVSILTNRYLPPVHHVFLVMSISGDLGEYLHLFDLYIFNLNCNELRDCITGALSESCILWITYLNCWWSIGDSPSAIVHRRSDSPNRRWFISDLIIPFVPAMRPCTAVGLLGYLITPNPVRPICRRYDWSVRRGVDHAIYTIVFL